MTAVDRTDIAIIGAGPAGSIAAAMLRHAGWRVTVLERSHFPRFTIGESLLPQCMEFLETAGMLEAVRAAGFQLKRGAAFASGDRFGTVEFAENFSAGWDWTWEVRRANFDQILIDEAARQGADARFGQTVEHVDFSCPGQPRLTVTDDTGGEYELRARFICDASGPGRVLPRMLDLDRLTDQPPRAALFTHVEDRVTAPDYDREMITICCHPEHDGVWYWFIPFSDGRTSVGTVGDPALILPGADDDPTEALRAKIKEEPFLARVLDNAVFDETTATITNYASSVSRVHGQDFALLGNAAGFIDPVFSSGVTLAMKSAVLAADLVDRQLRDEAVDWDTEFAGPLRDASKVFRAFVETWYEGILQPVFFKPDPEPEIQRMLASVLAGYVWDTSNPYVTRPQRRLRALCETCAA